jgi:hypothetical protein
MIMLGLVALVRMKSFNFKQFIAPIFIFAIFVGLAVILNTLHNAFINVPTFNMFYINPRYGTGLPVLRDIYPLVPYLVFLFIYIVGFSIGAFIIGSFRNLPFLFTDRLSTVQKKKISA